MQVLSGRVVTEGNIYYYYVYELQNEESYGYIYYYNHVYELKGEES